MDFFPQSLCLRASVFKSGILLMACLLGLAASAGEMLLKTDREYTFEAQKGKAFVLKLKPEWGVLALRTQMKTDALVPGRDAWRNGRIPMSFHRADGSQVGGWPNVFGFEGTRDWTDCIRDFPIPEGATELRMSLSHLGEGGTVSYRPLTLEVKRNRVSQPANAPLPQGAPSDLWSLDDAARVETPTRLRVCLNGLWGLRPALTNDAADVVPGPNDNWGWGKIPSVWGHPNNWTCRGQEVFFSDWFVDHGITPELQDRAWYRRDFTVPAAAAGQRVVLTFTMLQTRAVVYVDGQRAADVSFPGGEADITAFVKPGQKQSLVLDVTAHPLNPETLDFNAPDRALAKKSVVKFRGITGDLWLDILPKQTRIADATVEADTVQGRITFVAECEGLSAGEHTLVATVKGPNGATKTFTSGALHPNAEGRLAFTADWKDAARWDVHTPGNLYTCALELREDAGRTLDAAIPFRFGFRDIRAAGRDLLLNGTPIHLRALYNRTMNASPSIACKTSAQEMIRRLQSEGFNYIIAGNYNFSPGEVSYMDALLDACDETGMLFSFSLPHIRDFNMQLDKPEVAARYRALTRWCIRRARNHPSVITWAMSHNATGYCGDMNPLRIDGKYELKSTPQRSFRNRDQARLAAAIARSLDGTRPIYHHESGNLDDFHTVNIYLNWAPVQERSDWLEHWSQEGVKPLFFVEWGMPHISSWSSYRGPLFIWRKNAYQSLWASEFAAALRGDAAYEGDTPETVRALANEERLWAKGQPFHWSTLNAPLRSLTNNYQGVQALYMADNWRSHRAWGISAMLPWDQGEFHTRLHGHEASENPDRWRNLKQPGIVSDFFYADDWDTGTGDASAFARSQVGEVLYRWNQADCAFIGGDGVFTDKRHHYRPNETVKKTLVILNDRRVPQDVQWSCALKCTGAGAAATPVGNGSVRVAPGARMDVPVSLALPKTAGRYDLTAEFRFADGARQSDSFALESKAPVSASAPKGLLLYDTKGLTAALFDRLGIVYEKTTLEAPLPASATLAVGRGALTRALLDKVIVPAARRQARVLVFEQDKETLESLGFRVQAYGLRHAFPRFTDPRLGALSPDDLRDWCGAATLIPTHLTDVPEVEADYRSDMWSGYRNTRVWRCGHRGAVATVIPEKPSVGDWRALCDGGFDLQYAPLLDWTIERGRITFCQLDVTARTVSDPVADDLVRRLVTRLADELPWPRWPRPIGTRAWMAGRNLLIGLRHDPEERADGWYIVSSGAERPADFFEQIAKGGRALCLGLTADEVRNWSPAPLAAVETNGCYATRIERLPPELNGLSNADWSWHGAMDFAAFTEPSEDGNVALRVVRHGKGAIVFWQVPPWKIDAESKPYLRTSRRRADAMLARLLGNLGCASLVGSVLYRDAPVPEDDPYRYYRW